MLKKMMIGFGIASALLLSACPAPNSADDASKTESGSSSDSGSKSESDSTKEGSSSSGNFSKQAYLDLLNCIKTKDPKQTDAMDLAIQAVSGLPESGFTDASNPSFAAPIAIGKAIGCNL